MRKLLRRLGQLLNRRRSEIELAEEIELHRQLIEDRLRESGLPPADAAAESRRRLGNVTLTREDARAVWVAPWLQAVCQDTAYALRILHRAPGFAAAMIAVMALGIGATTGVFGMVDALVLRKLPVHEPERLVYFGRPSFSYPIFREVGARSRDVIASVAAWNMDSSYVAWEREFEPAEVLMASGNFFSTLGIGAAIGRTFGVDDDQIGGGRHGLVAVISHSAWLRRFDGDPAVVGRTVRVERNTFAIIGVTPAGFFGVAPGLAPEITIPLTSTASQERLQSSTSSWVHLLGRLRDDVSIERANSALDTFWPAILEVTTSRQMVPERRAVYLGRRTWLEPGFAGYSRVRNQFERPLWLLLALVTVLLAVGCASAANLQLARGVSRQREIAVRLAIGAARGRLIRQLLTESLVWTLLGSVAGLFLAYAGGSALVALMTTSQEPIALDLSLNWRTVTFSGGLAFVTACVCAVVPALRATRLDLGASLKETGQITSPVLRRWSLGRALVAAQVALTVLLLVGASLFVRSLMRVLAQDAGVDRHNVVVVATDPEAVGYEDARLAAFYERMQERLSALPGVVSVSLSMYPPISDEDGAWTQSIAIDTNPVPDAPGQSMVYLNVVSPGYFRTTGIPLVRGRDFDKRDTAASTRVVTVNESLARRFFGGEEPLGRLITIGRHERRRHLQIVGIVRDAKYQRMQEEPRSIAYIPHEQQPVQNLFAEVRTVDRLGSVAETIRREIRALDRAVPIRVETVADRIRESLVTERVMALLAATLGMAALVLACAGLYGIIAYAVSGRTREIGLRLALGARRGQVLRGILTNTLALAALGTVAGLAGALLFGQLAQNLLFQVSPRDPLSLVTAAAIMSAVAGLAGFLPARRASRVDPAVALRSD